MTVLIVVGIAAVLVFWAISVQRKLVLKDEMCQNSMGQIGVQQNSRWDAITSLVQLTKSYNEHEYKTLMAVIGQRKEINNFSNSEDAASQEEMLNNIVAQIKLVAEQYPELKANENYAKTMDSVNSYENQVRMSRMVFNDAVTKYNKIVRQIPDSIIASILGFSVKAYLPEPSGKTEMPSINI